MNRRSTNRRLFSFTALRSIFSVLMLTALLAVSTAASSIADGSTPLALTPGAPAGSYPLSGLDNINLFNGSLNFNLPLLEVGGRGGVRHVIGRTIEQHWRMDHYTLPDGREVHTPVFNPWTPLPIYNAPGLLYGRQVNDGWCAQGSPNESTLTRLTFVSSDGTEMELRDTKTGGVPGTSQCWYGGWPFQRGTVFATADGSAATFVSDTNIVDRVGGTGASYIYPSGYLMLRDGTRYRITNGYVTWIRDRNGNQLSFSYGNYGAMTVTDTLGRQVTVTPNVSDAQPYGLCDHITFSGFGGAQRTIRVSKTNLGNALRAGHSLQTPEALFGGWGSGSTPHDPQVFSAVWLPDGKSYQFRYNSYGELARVELPTGGAFEYDYTAGLVNGHPGGSFTTPTYGSPEIYRRLAERRVYKEGGALEGRMTISRIDSIYTADISVTVDQYNPSGGLLARSKHYFYSNPIKSFELDPMGSAGWKEGREYQTDAYDSNGATVLRRVEHTWQQPVFGSHWPLTQPETSQYAQTNNPQITETRTSLLDSNQISKVAYGYDRHGNRTDVYEYDFGYGAAPPYATRRTQTTFLTTNPANGLDYASQFANAGSIHLRNLPQHVRIYSVDTSNGAQTQVAHTETLYDETALDPWYGAVTQWGDPGSGRGNATRVRRWHDMGGNYVETRSVFDQVGNATKAVDALNRETLVQFSSAYAHSRPTQFTSPVPDPTGAFATNTPLVTSRAYDFWTGFVTSSTDPNNKVTTLEYNDPLDRLTRVNRPDGGWTAYSYDRALNAGVMNDYVRALTALDASRTVESYQFFDGLGRPARTFLHEGGSPAVFKTTDTQYDALGRAWRVSNAYRTNGAGAAINPSGRWTEITFDSLGRTTQMRTTADNAVVTTAYSGNSVTVTDQAGKKRRSVTDALNRLVRVDEPDAGGNLDSGGSPVQPTYYTYDVLGNLRRVDQGGQLRFFMYDSLGRLIRAKNPEQAAGSSASNVADPLTGNSQWSIAFGYDNNGNLSSRVDARNITTTYQYDALNRNTTVRYTDGTKDVDRHYDGAVNGRGRFWYFNWDGANNTRFDTHLAIDEYDAAGRPLVHRQHFLTNGTASAAFTVRRTYDFAGNITSQTYPSGRVVNYGYDVAGRLNSFTGNLGDGSQRTYSSEIRYHELSGMEQERFGTDTPVYNKRLYNSRGQLAEIRVSTFSITAPGQETNWNRGAIINQYSASGWGASGGGPDNNGNLQRQEVYIPHDDAISGYTNIVQYYGYDSLNRLASVEDKPFNGSPDFYQTYAYDRWGNRTINVGATWNAPAPQFSVDTTTNRLQPPAGYSMQYDAAGNLTFDNYRGQGTRTYDAENRMVSAQDAYGQTSTYVYDADGMRVRRRVANGAEVWQVSGMNGELLAEYAANASPTSPQKEYGYRGGDLLVVAEPGGGGGSSVNLAQGKPAAQSSDGWGGTASRAVDGNTDGNWNNSSVTHTLGGAQDWWQVDLGSVQSIGTVKLWNRTDCCGDRLSNFYVLVSDVPFSSTDLNTTLGQSGVSNYYVGPQAGTPTDVAVNRTGRYVRVQLAGSNYLSLAEVQVMSGGGQGLRAEYYNSLDFTNHALTRTDPTINFEWHGAAPGPGVNPDIYTTRWTGKVTPLYTQTYTFYTQSDDGVRLWVNGQLIIDKWIDQGWTEWSGQITLQAGVAYDIRMDFYERYGGAIAKLFWSSASQPKEIIPAGRLSPPGASPVRWLVHDQLGTPRMIVDQTGSLSGVRRHDYMPFGEEIPADATWRTAGRGYAGDNVRQKFTSYERDFETGLDYAQARYYASAHGRFTSIDPIIMKANRLADPQAINLYTYVRNNPFMYIDPNGEIFIGTDGKKVELEIRDGRIFIKSNNASDDLIKLVNTINASGSTTALTWFNRLHTSETMINLVINTTREREPVIGLHQPHGTRPDGTKGALTYNTATDNFEGRPDTITDASGNEVYKEATITLYEGRIRLFEGDAADRVEETMVGTFVHEAEHDLDLNQVQLAKHGRGSHSGWHPPSLYAVQEKAQREVRASQQFNRRLRGLLREADRNDTCVIPDFQ